MPSRLCRTHADGSLSEPPDPEMPDSATRLRVVQESSRIGAILLAELEFEQVIQRLADEATAACGASLGALFYSVPGTGGESDLFFALSGAPREAFGNLGLPRQTDYLTSTFHGRSLERLADVTLDPRHDLDALHLGIPVKSLSVRSYLALPVSSRSGEVLGRLFFGHPETGVFTSVHEVTLVGVAAHAAIAMENARLYRAAREARNELERTLANERAARAKAECALLDGSKRAALGAEVGVAMAGRKPLEVQLGLCAQAIVDNLDAALAGIWTIDEAGQTLVLHASRGLYTHVDGAHGRVPVGALKIGLIAQERAPHLTNDVLCDPRVGNKAWAAREGLVAFAGYPLIVDARVVGVMAMFSRHPLGDEALHALGHVADTIALGIDRRSSEELRARLLAREHVALAQAEAHRSRLHALFMQAPAVIAVFRGPNHVFEFANAHYQRVLGDGRELVGRAIRAALPELVAGKIFEILDGVYATGEAFFGTEVRSVFGRVVDGVRGEAYFNLVFKPTFDHLSRVDGVIEIAFDVTDQVLARRSSERLNQQLQQSEERYRSLIEATTQTVWITSPEGEMVSPQPGWEALTGQSQEQYRGHGWTDAVHPDDRAHTVALWDEARRSGELFVCEHRVRRHDGEWLYFRVSSAPVREPNGSIREWFGVHTDVSDKKLIEVERERLIAELKRSNEELDQFAYVASHDLKAPLRGIANLSQWVEEDLDDKISDEGRDQMRLLRGRVHRLEALINGILSYSRAGRIRERVEIVNVARLAREVVELLAPTTGVEVAIAADLPTIATERVPLQQVLMNLLSNAIKHANKTDPRVSITCSESRDGYSFMVKDNGPGINPAFHQRIWVIFQTLEPRDKVEATGIGLSIVKKIVESRGGRVWINSVLGAGAAFHFSWPVRAKASG